MPQVLYLAGAPPGVAQLLDAEDWRLPPHDVAFDTFRHLRGSCPLAVEVVVTLGKANNNVACNVTMAAKLRELRALLHQPALHDAAPKTIRAEAFILNVQCNQAGFSVHGVDSRSVVVMRIQLRAAISRKPFS